MLRTIPIRRIGNRHSLLLGGDRELTLMSALLSATLIFSAMDTRATIVGIGMWVFSLFALRLMGKSDPLMRQIYIRHKQYQTFYPARSTPFRENMKEYR